MNEKANAGQTMTRRDRCTRIITTLSRAGRDRQIHEALEMVLALRGLSALTDAALEDLATQVVADERARRFQQNRFAAKREQGCVIFLDQYRFQRKNWGR
ncbi:MAG TPA: hypothetical protein VGZ24_04485 [Chthoniobacterales bacterium]|jgi:hypothetical protein|nr:hypothetical protein [Chthoniobacterales bacterium]